MIRVLFTTSTSLTGWVIVMATTGNLSQTFTFTVPAHSTASVTSLMSLSCDKRITSGLSGVCDLRLSPSSTPEAAAISLTSSSSRIKVPDTLHQGDTVIFTGTLSDDGSAMRTDCSWSIAKKKK